jgi:hypothetical protein
MSNFLPEAENYDIANYQSNFEALPPQQWPDQWHASKLFPTPQSALDGNFRQRINEEKSFKPALVDYKLGDPSLPVAPYREVIVDTVNNSPASVISSETGSGKSSQIGLFLAEEGWDRVFVSSPRILAARELKDRARFTLGPDYADNAGYITGMASDSDHGPNTRVFYVTEELLFKMANRGRLRSGDVVINDEAHERTPATILLQGLMKEIISDNPDIRLVISSATIDTDKFSKYLRDSSTGKEAPVLILPGRTFPIEDRPSTESVALTARRYMKSGYNVLAFEPGLNRQSTTRYKMAGRQMGHTVHLLYGDQSPTEQAVALTAEDNHHIVSNRVGETSITPQNKNVVVDSGLSNIGRYEQGVRVLETVHSSEATMEQRRGRVGRTMPGIYSEAVPDDAPPLNPEGRDKFDISPIEISSIATYLAELQLSGRRIEDLDLIEHPNSENLSHDYKVLRRLGAIAVQDSETVLTEIGKALVDLPLDPTLARMVVEAREIADYYEVDPSVVRTQVAAATAIRQVNGILNAQESSKRRFLRSRRNDTSTSRENISDVLFELDSFVRLRQKQVEIEGSDNPEPVKRFEEYLRSKDIYINRYYKAFRTFEELCRRENLDMGDLSVPVGEERVAIIGCQIAGADELFVQKSKLVHLDIRGDKRRLGRKSTIDPSHAQLVIGTAFNLRGLRQTGRFEKQFITGASAVSSDQILRHAGHRVTREGIGHGVTREGDIVEKQALYFDGEMFFDESLQSPSPTFKTREFIIRAMMTGVARDARNTERTMAYSPDTPNARNALKRLETARDLDHRSRANLGVDSRYEKLIKKVIDSSVEKIPLEVTDPRALDELIPRVYISSLVRPSKKRDIPEIWLKSPDGIVVSAGEEEKEYVNVSYRENIAYVTIPFDLKYTIKPSDIEGLKQHHPVKLRVSKSSKGKYLQSEAFFEFIERERNAPQRVKRIERRAEAAEKISTPEGHAEAVNRMTAKPKREKTVLPTVLHLVKKGQQFKQRKPRQTAREAKEAKIQTSQ